MPYVTVGKENSHTIKLYYKDLITPFYGANRAGANVLQGLRDSFWLQGMLAGFKGVYDQWVPLVRMLLAYVVLAVAGLPMASHAAVPKDFNERNASVNGTHIHYMIGGTGPAVILLHGFTQTRTRRRHD